MLEYPKDIGTGLVPVSRFVPCRTFRWRHIYGSLKTSYWDLPVGSCTLLLPLQVDLISGAARRTWRLP
jgi:hypothetical protein